MIQTYKAKLIVKKRISRNVYLFRFDCLLPPEIIFKPGQYLILKVPVGEKTVSRLYSIASSSLEKNQFELIVKLIPNGLASQYLRGLELEEMVIFQGPAGLFSWRNSLKKKVLIAVGTGIVPFRSMLLSLDRNERKKVSIFFFWGVSDFKDVFFETELKKLSNEIDNFDYKICLSQAKKNKNSAQKNSNIFFGRLTKPLIDYLQKVKKEEDEFYLCGGRQVIESVKNLLLKNGVKKTQIFFEKF